MTATVAAATAVTVVSTPAPAGADNRYPSTCANPLKGDWHDKACWVGVSGSTAYATDSNYVLHVQTVTKFFEQAYTACGPGACYDYRNGFTRDGVLGASSKQVIKDYQSETCDYFGYEGSHAECVAIADGVVGPRTWGWMEFDVTQVYGEATQTEDYKYYQGENPSSATYDYVLRLDLQGTGQGRWQVLTQGGSWVDTNLT